jgi:hypothetical protein
MFFACKYSARTVTLRLPRYKICPYVSYYNISPPLFESSFIDSSLPEHSAEDSLLLFVQLDFLSLAPIYRLRYSWEMQAENADIS